MMQIFSQWHDWYILIGIGLVIWGLILSIVDPDLYDDEEEVE